MAADENILYSSVISEEITELVQTKIAPHLFLTCNYTPSPYLLLNEDAKFVVGILNLYKFTIDGSIIDKIPGIMDAAMSSTLNKKMFLEKIALVRALRTVFCHNESEISGNDDDIKIVDAWMRKRPQTDDDYKLLNQHLQKLASEVVAAIYQFIGDASMSKQKKALVNKWEEVIKSFYRRPNTKNILEGQLKKIYSARKGILSMNRSDNLDMEECVKKYYLGGLEEKLKEQESNYVYLCKTLSLPAESQAKLRRKVEEVEEELIERKKQIVERFGKNEITLDDLEKRKRLYLDLYLRELPQKISCLIDDSVDTNVYGTLLPQDIVQYIIQKDFDLILR